jgi:hypothetical protein
MKRLMRVLPLVLLVMARPVLACSCGFAAPFPSSGSLVIRGRPVEYHYASDVAHPVAMSVEVLEVMQGRFGARRITIMGDWGASCVPYVSNFSLGTEWLLSVGGPNRVPRFGDEVFSFPPCAQVGVEVIDGRVLDRGRIFTLAEMRKRFGGAVVQGIDVFDAFPRAGGSIIRSLSPELVVKGKNDCRAGTKLTYDVVIGRDGRLRAMRNAGGADKSGWCGAIACNALQCTKLMPATKDGKAVVAVQSMVMVVK